MVLFELKREFREALVLRKCPRCKEVKILKLFYKCHVTKTGASVYCKICTKTISKEAHKNKPKETIRSEKSRQPENRKEYRGARKENGLCMDCPNKARKQGYAQCQSCHNKCSKRQIMYASQRPWVKSNRHREREYGVTVEQYQEALFNQFGRCAICKTFFKKMPHQDHDHLTNAPRGLLCSRCNTALWIIDDKELCSKAIEYLNSYEKKVKYV